MRCCRERISSPLVAGLGLGLLLHTRRRCSFAAATTLSRSSRRDVAGVGEGARRDLISRMTWASRSRARSACRIFTRSEQQPARSRADVERGLDVPEVKASSRLHRAVRRPRPCDDRPPFPPPHSSLPRRTLSIEPLRGTLPGCARGARDDLPRRLPPLPGAAPAGQGHPAEVRRDAGGVDTCLFFFQVLLLGGYAYAHVVSRLTPTPAGRGAPRGARAHALWLHPARARLRAGEGSTDARILMLLLR